jgi:hypothetical protein
VVENHKRHERLTKETGYRSQWRWLGIATVGGALLGALLLGVSTYATTDNSEYLFSRGDAAFLFAILGAMKGAIAGFVLWALWVLSRTLVNRLSR